MPIHFDGSAARLPTFDEARAVLPATYSSWFVDEGGPEDYDLPFEDAETGEEFEAWFAAQEGPDRRRWLYVEAGSLARPEDLADPGLLDEVWSTVKEAGWEYMGSGGFRLEVDPASVPPTPSEEGL